MAHLHANGKAVRLDTEAMRKRRFARVCRLRLLPEEWGLVQMSPTDCDVIICTRAVNAAPPAQTLFFRFRRV